MKYNGNYFTYQRALAGKVARKVIRKKPKTAKRTKRDIMKQEIHDHIDPQFTFHSLERLVERMQGYRFREVDIVLGSVRVYGPMYGRWLDPKLITKCLEDIRGNAPLYSEYSTRRMTLIVKGKHAHYVLDKEGDIVTIITEKEKGYLKENGYTLASMEFVYHFLGIGEKIAKK